MVGPYLNNDKDSFAYTSLHKRWIAIIESTVTDFKQSAASEHESENQHIVGQIEQIKRNLLDDAEIVDLPSKFMNADVYNKQFAVARKLVGDGKSLHWTNAPWLLSECLLYRLLQQVFTDSEHYRRYDMFLKQKNSTFEHSSDAVSTLADRYVTVSNELLKTDKGDRAALEVLFHELLSTSLWGNATDLSLLVTVSLEELKKLQVAAESRDKEMLLVNDFKIVWKQMLSQVGGRVDIVLDNSGFELYTDLILTLFLLESGLAEQVVLHPKLQPWFVSDVVPHDFTSVLSLLSDTTKFPGYHNAINTIVQRLTTFMNEGQLLIRISDFWTTALPFWEINERGIGGGSEVWKDLRASKLVLFKGDLNYRKLTGDLKWPRNTPFSTAIKELATSKVPVVSLRTVKADVCVGLPEGKDKELAKQWAAKHGEPGEGWAWSGQYAVISANI